MPIHRKLPPHPSAKHLLITLVLAAAMAACGGGTDTATGTDPVATVTIVVQPLDSQVTSGSAARFSVSIQGVPQAYQWQRSTDGGQSWVAIDGATGATLDLAGVGAADNGHLFRVLVRSADVDTPSAAARLAVADAIVAPAISVAPADVRVTAGADAHFAVTATGTALTYQWQSSRDGATWTDIAGQATATLTLAAVAVDRDGLQLRVVVANSAGSQASAAALLSVQEASAVPVISRQPAAVAVVAPAAAGFSVAASGQPAPSFQWQRSTDGGASFSDIAGATSAIYSTGPTSLSDSGQRLRVLVSNSVGSVLSEAQTLSVSAAEVAAAMSLQPLDQRVSLGQTVSFTSSATGTPTPTLQWQISTDGGATWANIVGATATSHVFTAAAADDGRQFRVVASNRGGTAISRAALLTVVTPVSPLTGRAWLSAQSLEENSSTTAVAQRASAVDDAGRVMVVFIKSDGTRDRVYATRGTPNSGAQAPLWSAAKLISGNAAASGGRVVSVTSAPGGDMVALWAGMDTCTADSYLGSNQPFSCQYFYFAQYRAATDTWDAPQVLTDSDTTQGFQTWTNDRGDLVFLGQSWLPGAALGSTLRFVRLDAVFMRTATDSSFRRHILSELTPSPFEKVLLDLDADGNLLMGAKLRRSGIADIVAYRGTVAAGFGNPVSLEDRTANAELAHAKLGRFGQQVIVWYHINDTDLRAYAATSSNASDSFSSNVISESWPGNNLVVTDEGQAILHTIGNGSRLTWTASGGWTSWFSAGHTDSFLNHYAVSRNGLVLSIDGVGMTSAYDLRINGPVISAPSAARSRYVLGFANGTVGVSVKPLVAVNGIGFVDLLNDYVSLPTVDAPAGAYHPSGTRAGNSALWGAFLR
jgi:hypothetical protein